MDELNGQKLQKLLKLKKLETPGKEYFDGFLEEFHRYQQAEILRRASRWEPLHAWFREMFVWAPRRTPAIVGCCAALVVMLTVAGLGGNLFKNGVSRQYAKTRVTPGANVQLVSDNGNAEENSPRYSTGQTPLPYEKTIAF
jgi:hypothetical protein